MIQAQMNQTLTTATFTPDVFAIYREVVSEDLINKYKLDKLNISNVSSGHVIQLFKPCIHLYWEYSVNFDT